MHCSLSSGVLASTTSSSWAGASTVGMPKWFNLGSTKKTRWTSTGFASFNKARIPGLEQMHERSALIFCASLASPVAQAARKTQCQHAAPMFCASGRVRKLHAGPPCSFGTISSFSLQPDSPLGFFDPSFSSRDAEAILRNLRRKAYALGPTPISLIDDQQPPSREFNCFIYCICKLSLSSQNCLPNHQ
jgi:hypothetical protein